MTQVLGCKSNDQLGTVSWKDMNGDKKVDFICEYPDGTFEVCISTGNNIECIGQLIDNSTNSTLV